MTDRSVLYTACRTNNVELLETFFTEHPEIDNYVRPDIRCKRPMHWAIEYNSCQIVDYLFKNKLVDILSSERLDYLSYAIGSMEDSSDIVKILTEYDHHFQLADACMKYGAVFSWRLNKVRILVETLKVRNYAIPQTVSVIHISESIVVGDPEKLSYFLEDENFKFLTSGDKQQAKELLNGFIYFIHKKLINFELSELPKRGFQFSPSKWTENLNKIFSIMFEICADNFGNNLLTFMTVMIKFHANAWIDRCIKTWYLTESNEHRNLVEKLLNQQQNGIQNVEVIMGLLSHAPKLRANDELNKSNRTLKYYMSVVNQSIYKQLVQCLAENATEWTNDEINEIGSALGPKLDDELFSFAFHEFFSRAIDKTTAANIFKIVNKMGLADKTQYLNRFVLESELCWLPLMAFSTATSADAYLTEVRKYWKKYAIEIQEEFSSFNYPPIRVKELTEEKLNRSHELWLKVKQSKTMADFRAKSRLKGLCRTKIRETLRNALGTKTTHSQLVKNVKLLELPKKVERFVLFNYTDYDF